MKKLRLNDIEKTKLLKDFEKFLETAKISGNKVSFSQNVIPTAAENTAKATVLFKEKAWRKMALLVREFSSEVAWHGVVNRVDDYSFEVTDILVYPQTVTGVTVNTDQEEYEMWLMRQPDEVFNNIRFQGHSHVNMGVTPSGTDETHQAKIVEQLGENDFYIFIIINKSHNTFTRIYDMKNNLVFEPGDIVINYEPNELDDFLAVSKANVKTKTTTTYNWGQNYRSPYAGQSTYGGTTKVGGATLPTDNVPAVNSYRDANKAVLAEIDDADDGSDEYARKWYDIYGYDDEPGYLPGYPNYNAAVKNGKKKKKK